MQFVFLHSEHFSFTEVKWIFKTAQKMFNVIQYYCGETRFKLHPHLSKFVVKLEIILNIMSWLIFCNPADIIKRHSIHERSC